MMATYIQTNIEPVMHNVLQDNASIATQILHI